MDSQDVKSPLTNVSVQGCSSKNRLYEFNYSFSEIDEIVQLVSVCVRQNSFLFNSSFYSQSCGWPMDNPLSSFYMIFTYILFKKKCSVCKNFLYRLCM